MGTYDIEATILVRATVDEYDKNLARGEFEDSISKALLESDVGTTDVYEVVPNVNASDVKKVE